MIIRSQNKKTLTNFLNITDLSVEPLRADNKQFGVSVYYPFSLDEGYSKMCLGEYSTEEKAIKVLDMIQKRFLQYGTITKGIGVESAFVVPRCFEMPSDEEVEV